MTFQDPHPKTTNYYQLEKTRQFLQQLDGEYLATFFTDSTFQRLISNLKITLKKKNRAWVAKVSINTKLIRHNYPILFPDLFKTNKQKDQFRVQFYRFKVFSSISPEKVFSVKEFLEPYQKTISKQRVANLKRYLIQVVHTLQQQDFIQKKYKILFDGTYYNVTQLTTRNISQGFIIYENLRFINSLV